MKKSHLLLGLAMAGLLFTGGVRLSAAEDQKPPGEPDSFAGRFLAGHFAQSENDWIIAEHFLETVLKHDPDNADILKRAMVLATGGGDLQRAAVHAEQLLKQDDKNNLAWMIKTVALLKKGDAAAAQEALGKMPEGDVTDFVRPLIQGWLNVAQGKFGVEGLNETTIHSYNAALMALAMDKKTDAVTFAGRMKTVQGMSVYDVERAGDLYNALGDNKTALEFYQAAAKENPQQKRLAKKIGIIQGSDKKLPPALNDALRIRTPTQGVAAAMSDLARILFQEYSDSSVRIFAQLALALDPDYTDAKLLLAHALARSGRPDEAIAYFSTIRSTDESYLEIQHYIADLYEESGQTEKALNLLNDLFKKHNDVEALIRIGDIYRNKENYSYALKAYNRAAGKIGKQIPEEYWYLLYARGMVYEREGEWSKAEEDLKAALGYRPDHPYLLNYLGYAWADQGVNLDESLKLLERAVSLRPEDGFIRDSLGWVHYMSGKYEEAVPQLEKAVELMPYDATLNDHLGDAYWQVGRKVEARFQWERAYNYASEKDEKLKGSVMTKLGNGLPAQASVQPTGGNPVVTP